MFANRDDNSTAMNYVSRYYQDDVYQNDNVFFSQGPDSRPREPNGFILVEDLAHTRQQGTPASQSSSYRSSRSKLKSPGIAESVRPQPRPDGGLPNGRQCGDRRVRFLSSGRSTISSPLRGKHDQSLSQKGSSSIRTMAKPGSPIRLSSSPHIEVESHVDYATAMWLANDHGYSVNDGPAFQGETPDYEYNEKKNVAVFESKGLVSNPVYSDLNENWYHGDYEMGYATNYGFEAFGEKGPGDASILAGPIPTVSGGLGGNPYMSGAGFGPDLPGKEGVDISSSGFGPELPGKEVVDMSGAGFGPELPGKEGVDMSSAGFGPELPGKEGVDMSSAGFGPELAGKDGGEDIPNAEDMAKKTTKSTNPVQRGFCYWYASFLARFPVLVCFVLLVLTIAAGAVAFTLYDIPNFDDPEKGFESRHTSIRDRLAGLELFITHEDDANFHVISQQSKRDVDGGATASIPPTSSSNDATPQSATMTGQSTDFGMTTGEVGAYPTPCISSDSFSRNFRIAYSSMQTDGDLFIAEAFHSMCSLYDNYVLADDTTLSEYIRHCEPVSLGQYAALLSNKSSCFEANEDDAQSLKDLLQRCAPFYTNGTLREDCSHTPCPSVPGDCTTSDIPYLIYHYLLPSGSATKIAHGDFDVLFTLMISPMSGYGDEAKDIYTGRIQGRKDLQDGITRIFAIGGQFKFDLFAQFLLSDLILVAFGVGIILVIVWLYTGSLFVTAMTIVDMAMSLVLSYFLYVVVIGLPFFPFVNILAVILLLGIGADDAFVYMDIWRKTGDKYENKVENRIPILQETLHHASITMFVTSFTTASALYFSITSSITAIQCFAVYAGSAILFNLVFTVTWLPAIVIIEEKYLKIKDCRQRSVSKCTTLKKVLALASKGSRHIFEKLIPWIVFKFRYVWLILFTLLGIGGGCSIFVYPQLKLPTQSQFQIFVLSDFLEQYDIILTEELDFEQVSQEKMPIKFLWGLVPVDNGDSWNPDDRGHLLLDENFNISDPESQEWLLQFCSDIKNQTFYSEPEQSPDFCFIDVMKETLMEGPCYNPIFRSTVYPCCNVYDFPYEPELFQQCTAMFINLSGLDKVARFDERNRLTGLMMSFTSTTSYSLNYERIDEFWKTVNDWGYTKMKDAPQPIAGGWFASFTQDQLFYFDLQHSLVTETPFSIGMSLGVASLVLLLTTWDVLITLFAFLSISGTVFVTIGCLVLSGWELNILESTIMSLAVGLSVDFTIHYGVAYRIAPYKDRASRSEYAMKQLISAISTAAFSTFVAGACMIPATVYSYQQVGIFLTLVMTTSWLYGTFFFMSLCRVIGPEGNCTDTCGSSSGCCCCRRKSNPNNEKHYEEDVRFHNVHLN